MTQRQICSEIQMAFRHQYNLACRFIFIDRTFRYNVRVREHGCHKCFTFIALFSIGIQGDEYEMNRYLYEFFMQRIFASWQFASVDRRRRVQIVFRFSTPNALGESLKMEFINYSQSSEIGEFKLKEKNTFLDYPLPPMDRCLGAVVASEKSIEKNRIRMSHHASAKSYACICISI